MIGVRVWRLNIGRARVWWQLASLVSKTPGEPTLDESRPEQPVPSTGAGGVSPGGDEGRSPDEDSGGGFGWADPREIRLAAIAQRDPGGTEGRAALGELLGGYQRPVFSLCYRMVGDSEVAADLTQETLCKAIRNFASYDGRSRLAGWLFRIASNTCVSYFRRQKYRSHASLDATLRTSESGSVRTLGDSVGVSREPEPSSGVEKTEAGVALSRALMTLAPLHRAILLMRDAHGMEYALIAEALDISIGTVKSRLFRARAALRAAIEQEPDGGAS
ncbi:MAG: RNA polymerase sigma factor [Planctomycetota bacterium]